MHDPQDTSSLPGDPEALTSGVREPHPLGGSGPEPKPGVRSEQFWGAAPPHVDPVRIGPYKIVRRLGEGGMGLVYLATRDDDQFRKRVAIKVIKRGMDSESILRRFEQERQVLAALNHSGIARLLDGGATEDKRPFFVMEYVEGLPIHEYCDKNRLRLEERLQLFATLCQAVHHAHQNLIVHRDLKPSNVVVTQEGELKLLDFGIAKLLNPDMAAFASEPTQTSLRLMTPEYASPEQVRGDPISTASDIYSLGVLLYELVSGHRPYQFKTRLQSEIERVICEEDPEKPSTVLTRALEVRTDAPTMLAGVPSAPPPTTVEYIAKVRDERPGQLRRRLRGDIDNMVMLAMRKEPRRRYGSAQQFAEDIKRHLEGMPVVARPATWGYRSSKFVRRNKAGVAAAAVIAMLLVGGIVVSTTLARIAERERDAADHAKTQAETLRELATKYYYGLDEELETLPESVQARQAIVNSGLKYLRDFEKAAHSSPALQRELAEGYMRMGDIQGGLRSNNLGATSDALGSYRIARERWEALIAESPHDAALQRGLAEACSKTADLHRRDAQPDKALPFAQRAHDIALKLDQSDRESRRTLARSQLTLADVLAEQPHQLPLAADLFQRSRDIRWELWQSAPDEPTAKRDYTVILTRLGDLAAREQRFDAAFQHYDECARLRGELAARFPDNTRYQRDLLQVEFWRGQARRNQHDPETALEHFERAHDIASKLHQNDVINVRSHHDLGNALNFLGEAAFNARQFPRSVEWFEQAVDVLRPAAEKDPANVRLAEALRRARQGLSDAQLMGGASTAAP